MTTTQQPVTQRAASDVLASIRRILDDAKAEAGKAALYVGQDLQTAVHNGLEAVKEHLETLFGHESVHNKVGAAMTPSTPVHADDTVDTDDEVDRIDEVEPTRPQADLQPAEPVRPVGENDEVIEPSRAATPAPAEPVAVDQDARVV